MDCSKNFDKIFEDWDDEEFESNEFQVGDRVKIDPSHDIYNISEYKDFVGKIIHIDDNKYPIKVLWKFSELVSMFSIEKKIRYLREELIRAEEFIRL